MIEIRLDTLSEPSEPYVPLEQCWGEPRLDCWDQRPIGTCETWWEFDTALLVGRLDMKCPHGRWALAA